MRFRALCSLVVVSAILSTFAFAATADRITSEINTSQSVRLTGNLHGLARSEFDVGRMDGARTMSGVTLVFRLSPDQQKALDLLLTQLQKPNSPNYHKFLTPAQFAARFGMSLNDINRVQAWLRSERFTNVSVANSHNAISFDGTVAQVERVFATEIHAYLVEGVVHLANATEPSVPAAMADAVMFIDHLNSFSPKPRVEVQPHLTSYVTGNHFLTPDDFATISDVNALYTGGSDGTGQKIAIVGQSTVSTTDLNNFRTNAGLPASTVTMTLIGGTAQRCSGDEFESDLDIEWSGGVAKNASITFVYAGLSSGDTCGNRQGISVWNALDYAVQNNVAPFISTSYGFCEQGLPTGFPATVQGWAQQGQSQGQTMVSASGDAGAADCDATNESSATGGLAVDVPASIPEVTGAGGNEFTGDMSECPPPPTDCTTNTAPADPPYWAASGAGSDAISTALEYIPETAWNDTKENNALSASGGGASVLFSKPSWQTGTGVPNDGKRDVPDVAISASPDHDSYLICSEDDPSTGGTEASCVSGFRDAVAGNYTAVGGTSAAAPTFTAIMALVNQFVGNTPPTGLAPINPTLYELYPYTTLSISPNPFHDVTSGNNIVPCTTGSTGCTTGSYGFNAGVGYDQVTGLGSVDAFNLATVWARALTTTTVSANPSSVNEGASVTFTATVTPSTVTGTVNFYNVGSTTSLGSGTVSSGTATLTTTALPAGTNSVTAVYGGDTADRLSTSTTPAVVTVQPPSFTLNPASGFTLQVAQGSMGSATFTLSSTNGFLTGTAPNQTTILPVSYTCTDPAPESTCTGPTSATTATSVSFTIQTAAASARLQQPFARGSRIFYAALLPGLLGIMFTIGSRRRSLGGMRVVGLIVVLGFSTLWLGSCSGSNGGSGSQGTPPNNYMITINATTGGATPVTSSATFTLDVTAAAK